MEPKIREVSEAAPNARARPGKLTRESRGLPPYFLAKAGKPTNPGGRIRFADSPTFIACEGLRANRHSAAVEADGYDVGLRGALYAQ